MGEPNETPLPGPDFTVTFEVSVTAEDFQQAAEFALDDLRDRHLGPWNAEVKDIASGESRTVEVTVEEVEIDDDEEDEEIICAECREPLGAVAIEDAIQAKDGAWFHAECWDNAGGE